MLREEIRAAKDTPLDLTQIYRRHGREVARWVARLGGPDADLEDLVHEVFVVVDRRLGGFRGDAKLTTWLYRITENVVRHQRRKNRLRSWLLGDDATEERACPAPLPDEALEKKRAIALVYEILDRIGEKYRTVLILHEIEGLTGPEIAELTGVKPSTVWVRIHRAKARFSAELKRRDG